MKLTDEKKVLEENGIQFENCKDIESLSTELKRDEEEAGLKGKIRMDMNRVTRKCTGDGALVNGKKVREEENKNNFNMDIKEQEKNIKSITEDLEKLGFDSGATDNKKVVTILAVEMEKPRRGEEKEISLSVAEIGSENAELEVKAEKCRSTEDIVASMNKLGLGSGMKTKDKDLAKPCHFDLKALLRGLSDEQVEPDEERLRTVEIIAQPENKCEENEDFEETRVLSDSTEENTCSSFVARGPPGGVPKDNEYHDLSELLRKGGGHFSEVSHARKYSRPSNSEGCNPIMSGGCVQVVQPDVPVHSLYGARVLEELNISSQYPGQRSDNFLVHASSEGQAEHGIHTYYDDDLKNYPYGCHAMPQQQHCSPFYDGSPRGAVYPPVEEFPGGYEMFCNYNLDAEQAMNGMPYNHLSYYQFNGQMGSPNPMPFPSSRSTHDHCLTSPGSSPPSVLSCPLSPASTILTNGDTDFSDLSALSPGQFSPESGFMTDASRDLEDALELINEDLEASRKKATGNNASFLPVMVANPSAEFVIGPASSPCQNGGNASQRTKTKKQTGPRKTNPKRSQKVAQPSPVTDTTPRILPPANGMPYTIYSPGGLGADQLSAYIVIEQQQPIRSQKQAARTQVVPILPKKTAEPSAQSAIKPAPTTDVSSSPSSRFSPPSATLPSAQEPAVTSSSDQDQLVKAYRAVAGLPKEQLLGQDDDGDTILHLAIVKDKTKLVKALLERYVREGLIDKVINLANKQHQTPLCLAVFLNQTEIVKMLIERKADVNVQLQRKLNGGLKCYRLIHYAASRGKKWVPTLFHLLSADNIDLQAFNSEGCTAMHCAIECHGKHYQQGDEKIDSKDTIYYLAKHGADLNVQHGLCGKTPLHYAIEKKDSDLVGWFLGLASYIQSSGTKQSNGFQSQELVHGLLNAKPSGGVTALQLALGLQMERTERIPILRMLLRDGAEVSQKGSDGKLRQELAKYPELADLLKNGTNAPKNGPR